MQEAMDSSSNKGISGNRAESCNVKKQIHPPQIEKEALVTLFNAYRYSEAEASARKLTERFPDDHFGWNALGTILAQRKQSQEAVPILERALELCSNDISSLNSLAFALQDLGRNEEALSRFVQALELNPNDAMVHNNMGNILQKLGKYDEALTHYTQALEIYPNYVKTYNNMGHVYHDLGKSEEAIQSFNKALEIEPDNTIARFGRCFSTIPVLYENAEEIPVRRDQYRLSLIKLKEDLLLGARAHIDTAAKAVGSQQPFLLAYQGYNNRELQSIYGDLVCKIQAKRYPQWSKIHPMPSITADENIRVGIVSGFFYYHSNWKIRIQGWVDQLDRNRFSIYGYYTGRKKDKSLEKARWSIERFREDCYSLERLSEIIRNDRLHVLIFPEIGMDPMTVRLASLRLAPIQCTSWGHPDTSGLPTIDYYLSSDLMEPPDADSHYTERLVRLPNLSVYYQPLEIQPARMDRSDLGLPQDAVLYFCPQSLFKYLPQYDQVFPRIAKQVDKCRFIFIKYSKSSHLDERFLARLRNTFAEYGMCENYYVGLLPRLTPERYQAINRLCDVFLDSIGWSGCNTTMEAIANDLPVVTMPGDLMRGRHSYAIMTMMGVTETIAESLDEFIDLAVRLGRDSQFRSEIKEKISQNKHKVYRDTSCIKGLEAFLKEKVAASLEIQERGFP
jgi:protein O-GlcNAc transferase